MDLIKKKRVSSILGLSLDGSRLEGVVVRRTNGSVTVQKSLNVSLSLDPLTNDPELAGQEIRNHLEKAGIRERTCAVCLPPSWALTLQTKVPDLPEADLASLVQLEAERGFPYSPENLLISSSRVRASAGDHYVTQIAVPREHALQLERVLKAAKLAPIAFSLGMAELQPPGKASSEGMLALHVGESAIHLQISIGGGVAALRVLEGALEIESGHKRLNSDVLAREVRITLGQLPDDLRASVRLVKVFGSGDLPQQVADQLRSRLEPTGLKVKLVAANAPEDFTVKTPVEAPVSPAFSLATRIVSEPAAQFNFLPPKVKAWQQFTARHSSRKVVWAAAAAIILILLVGGAFAYQQYTVSSAETRWSKLAPAVTNLENLQFQIRRFRPWFDDSKKNLNIMFRVTEAFPQDPYVVAKTIEIREMSNVSCSGTARDNQALLRALDALRTVPEISDLKVDSIRGKSPLQFTFNFHWGDKTTPQ